MLTIEKGGVIIDIEGACGAGWIRIILVPGGSWQRNILGVNAS